MILHGGKDIENREWCTGYRGRFLLHAGLTMTQIEYEVGLESLKRIKGETAGLPPPGELQRGGIVGSVVLVDCVETSASRWHDPDSFGFVLRDPLRLRFTPFRGRLQFFNVPNEALAA